MWVWGFGFFWAVAALTLPDLDSSAGSDGACSSLRRLSAGQIRQFRREVSGKQVLVGGGKQ